VSFLAIPEGNEAVGDEVAVELVVAAGLPTCEIVCTPDVCTPPLPFPAVPTKVLSLLNCASLVLYQYGSPETDV